MKKNNRPTPNPKMLVFFITATLLTIPLNYGFSSAAVILFVVYSLITAKKEDFVFNISYLFPVLLFGLMVVSLLWSIDFNSSLKALSKEISLLIIPILFSVNKLWQKQQNEVIKYFSLGMVCYGIFYIGRAIVRYFITGNTEVFFYHELVTKDLNAIYSSVFMSVAMFYYISKKQKILFDYIAGAFLFLLIFLLSSKNILIVDILLIVLYLLFYSGITKKARWITIALFCAGIVLLGYNGKIRERIYEELNPVNERLSGDIYAPRAVNVKEAWNDTAFEPNDYFGGTSFRVYQARIFTEMLQEDPIFFGGYGINASLEKIKEKGVEHNVFQGDGKKEGYNTLNFHNQYIEAFADLGIIGLILVLIMVFVNAGKAFARKDFTHIAFAIIMITLFLTESFLWRQRGVIFFTVLYCVFNKDLYSSAIEKEKK